jgi:hypothetical protein
VFCLLPFGKLSTSKMPITADLLYHRALPF